MSASDNAIPSTRWYYLDSLRAILMLIGIPFHSARFFRADVELIDTVARFSTVWRMTTFFVIAGFFALLIIQRRGASTWFRGRLKRLGIPLLFAVLVLNPFQTWMLVGGEEAVERLTARVWPWLHHAWFLLYLLIYCAILALVVVLTRGAAEKAFAWLARVVFASSWTLALSAVVAGVVSYFLVHEWLALGVKRLTYHAFTVLMPIHAISFLAGVLLAAGSGPWGIGQVGRIRSVAGWPVVAVALLGTAWVLVEPVEIASRTTRSVAAAAAVGAGLAWAALLLKYSERLFPRDTMVVRWLVSASLPVYLLHQVVVYSVGPYVVDSGLGPVAGFVLLTVIVLVVSFLLYELANRFAVTRFLLSGTSKPGVSVVEVLQARREPRGEQGRVPVA
jgi:glucan biosynthesis protein C